MHLFCPSCDAPIHDDDVDLRNGAAACRACGAEVTFDRARGGEAVAKAAPRVPRPDSVTVEADGDGVIYRRRWFGGQVLGAVATLLFIAAWCLGVYTAETGHGGSVSLFGRAVITFWGAVGVLVVYSGIAHVFNTTTLRLDRRTLVVRHGPIPWPDNLEVHVADIRQLRCERQEHRSSRGATSYSYDLTAIVADGRKVKVLSGLASSDVPRYLEQQMERWLGIRDEPMAGERVP